MLLHEAFEWLRSGQGAVDAGPLILRRTPANDSTWSDWQQQQRRDLSVFISLTVPAGQIVWQFNQGLAQAWRLEIGSDGLPYELVELRFGANQVTRMEDQGPPSGIPGLIGGDVASGLPPGSQYQVLLNGQPRPAWRVRTDRGLSFAVQFVNGLPLPASPNQAEPFWLRQNPTGGFELHEALTTLGPRTLSLRLQTPGFTRTVFSSTQALVTGWRLQPTDDGLVVEDYRVDAP